MTTFTEKTLFRLFAANSALYSISVNERIVEFLERVLATIPGIGLFDVCLVETKKSTPNQLDRKFYGNFPKDIGLEELYLFCQKNQSTIKFYPVRTTSSFYGFIAVIVNSPSEYSCFDSIVNNFAITISTILERKYQEKKLEEVNAILEKHKESLQMLVSKKTASLEKTKKKLEATLEEVIKTLAITVELRDPYTAGHQYRVAKLAEAIAKKLNLPHQKIHKIYKGALIHDIGKIQIPLEILTSPAKLNQLQFAFIKTHPEAGEKIIHPILLGKTITDIVLHHHERLDGSGYPHGLKKDAIPLETRIVSVADVFEAMFSHRPYRPKHSLKEVLEELHQGAGKIYDASVVSCCIELISQDHFTLPTFPNRPLFNDTNRIE